MFGSSIPNPLAVESAADEESASVFICDISIGSVLCNQSFPSKRALLAHQRHSAQPGHNVVRILHKLTIANRCIVCKTTFRNQFQAGQHLTRSWYAGRCLKNYTHEIHTFVQPRSTVCPICELDVVEFEDHLALHIPLPPSGALIRVVIPPSTVSGPRAQTAEASRKPHTSAKLGPSDGRGDAGRPGQNQLESKAQRIFARVKKGWEERRIK